MTTNDLEERRLGVARRLTVLVVEDCEDSSELLSDLISSLSHDVRVARTGAEALAAFAQGPADLVFLDLGLPDMDGFEVAREIRARFSRDSRIVALTGFSETARRDTAQAAGCNGFLVKPVRFVDLQKALLEAQTEARP
jgi:CheY-like chemotaxis protein